MLESRRVVVRYCARWLLGGAAVTWSALAPALGLGDITLHSALNQPLRADIALVDAAGLEEDDLSVSLATADEYSRAGVDRVFFLNDLKFTPILRGKRNVIRVTSSKPVNEPFLNFLVQLNQPNGRLLREYTVLIDPPGTPGIVPVDDEPQTDRGSSAFPSVQPATPAVPARQEPKPKPATVPVTDPLAEQLAASVLQVQQLQATIEELNAKLQAQVEQIAGEKKQVIELQTRLAEAQSATAEPVTPAVVAPAPIVAEQPTTNWLLIGGLLTLAGLLLLAWFVRRRQQSMSAQPATSPPQQAVPGRLEEPLITTSAVAAVSANSDELPVSDVFEEVAVYLAYGRFTEAVGLLREAMDKEPERTDLAVQLLEVLGKQGDASAYDALDAKLRNAGFDEQKLMDIRARHPKLNPIAAVPVMTAVVTPLATAPGDESQLKADDLVIDTNWDLLELVDTDTPNALSASELDLPEPEIEWEIESASRSLDDSFLDEFREPSPSLELEPINLEPVEPSNAGKLEQAQTCIDDGDLDSAIALLNELLRDAEEPLKRTARTLLAGIR
ncbi:FimV/HubP family polar landmark protein [Pseudomonas sp. Sample_22]|uniref:FimV/HubP family polar landmark protein n=1 Tax=Pseudomonas sp. Sample_22 TaxID=2448266 RepID=UPI0010328D23|nr:FimV/HubP family polar landmark protein [Pseudomonas sp. Sample_22]